MLLVSFKLLIDENMMHKQMDQKEIKWVSKVYCLLLFQFVSCSSDLVSMAAQRQAKIERYRQKKELESRISDLRKIVDSGQADDEVVRDFYILNAKRWVTLCLEEVESISQEVEILKKMDGVTQSSSKQPPVRPPIKPFILTKNAVQVGPCVGYSILNQQSSKKSCWFAKIPHRVIVILAGCRLIVITVYIENPYNKDIVWRNARKKKQLEVSLNLPPMHNYELLCSGKYITNCKMSCWVSLWKPELHLHYYDRLI